MAIVLNRPFLQPFYDELFDKKQLNVFILRDDLVHPFLSGNKWRKLKYNLEEFQKKKYDALLTFGGAYSNLIVAAAATGKESGIKTIGVIRGEEHHAGSNPVLRFADECGMKLIFVSRKKYRSYREHPDLAAAEFQFPCSRLYVLPEGGSNELAVAGCREICDDIPADADYICCDCGTGATLAGIVSGLKDHQQAIGIAVLKANDFLERTVEKFNGQKNNFQVIHDYHFGGYAKSNNELEDFCRWMTTNKNIPVEPVYTGKLFFAVYDLIRKDFFRKNSTLVIVHTGGVIDFNPSLQANNGMNESPETGKQPQPGFSG